MSAYTAKQLTELLQPEHPDLQLRTVRYYTQIGLLPPLELAGNKRVYTDLHIQYLRAILTLSRSGESLASIQQTLSGLSAGEIRKIGDHSLLYEANRLIQNETIAIGEDVILSISPRIPEELKTKMIDTVSRMLKGENR